MLPSTVICSAGLSPDAPYVERSIEPLDPPGWDTYRRMGCYKWDSGVVPEIVAEDSSPKDCAASCSNVSGRGAGFFGVTSDGG